MIRASQLALRRGAKLLFNNAQFSVFPGQRVGVVGRNGCGKSSLFGMIAGRLSADAGTLTWPSAWEIAELEQHVPSSSDSALEFVKQGDRLLARLDAERMHSDPHHAAEVESQFADADGYRWEARAGELLSGMGFSPAEQQAEVDSFSGGWRMRLKLTQTLMRRADLLLLDEPTNHLDLDAVLWFGDWLTRFPGTLLLISHDRDFLDQVCTHILFLDGETATLYTGNFTAFARQRMERMSQQLAEAQQMARQRAHLQKFVDRFRAKASKARQAQSRIKMLERLGEAPAPRSPDSVELPTPQPKKLPTPLLKLEDASVGYGDDVVLSQVRFSVEPGERIGILGRNGAGKSTLMKLIGGSLPAMSGTRYLAPDTVLRHFTQFEVEALPADRSPLLLLSDAYPETSMQGLRDWLGAFKYSGDMATSPIGPRSGGEKARFVLARMLYGAPNLILLDEPTNHLDIEMREALTDALSEFTGAVILVAHDRALLESCCEQYLVVADGVVAPFEGDLDQYAQWLRKRRSERARAAPVNRVSVAKVEPKPVNKRGQNELKKAEQAMEQASQQLQALQSRQTTLAAANSVDVAALSAVARELIAAQKALDTCEAHWMTLAEACES